MQMESISEFERRLKLIQSRTRKRAQRVYVPSEDDIRRTIPTPRPGWPMPIIATVVGVALLAGLIAVARDDIARLMSAPDEAQRVSLLDSNTSDPITN
ncbi:hypothetical protein [uncultured Tateyamaria sp.]|uniref:hypothetical protein n=1 Tax=uncultured Tateyamaria sp. TaxID=455651 RepID=UPI00261C26E1|nr:hypothetical protein [uncultured Tateyamaria sp.]